MTTNSENYLPNATKYSKSAPDVVSLVDDLLRQAKTLTGCSVEGRGELYRQVQSIIYEDQPYNFLYVPRDILVYNSRIGGMNPGSWEFRYNMHEWFIQD